jgi:hypothetical protein
MVWTDVSFKVLTHLAMHNASNALNNTLLGQALIDGHVATQVMAMRRLMDDGRNDIISLRRLVKDLKRNFALFTRENFVCFDGRGEAEAQEADRGRWRRQCSHHRGTVRGPREIRHPTLTTLRSDHSHAPA